MPRVLLRAVAGETRRLDESGGKEFAGTSRRGRRAARDSSGGHREGSGIADPGEQLFQRARGCLPSGHAAGQLRLLTARYGLGIAAAQIAALAAIELSHRGHEPMLDRPRGGEREAVVERQCRVVPRKVLGLCLSWLGLRLRLRREGGWPGRSRIRKQRGEIAVEPGALQRRERRVIGQDGRDKAHAAAPLSSAASCSGLWRLAKAWKVSARSR